MAERVVNYIHEFESGLHFDEYIATAQKNADLWRGIYARAQVSTDAIEAIEATERQWHLLVISEDWCGDAVNTVPVVARIAEQARNVDMRVIKRDDHLDVMDRHLSPTGGRAIPVVIVLDDAFNEVGWWGSRPSDLQAWYMSDGRAMEKDARYKHIRTWYARDKGVATVAAISAIIERAAQAGGVDTAQAGNVDAAKGGSADAA
jgi:hypothetical protein